MPQKPGISAATELHTLANYSLGNTRRSNQQHACISTCAANAPVVNTQNSLYNHARQQQLSFSFMRTMQRLHIQHAKSKIEGACAYNRGN
jgi:hypothetical protein